MFGILHQKKKKNNFTIQNYEEKFGFSADRRQRLPFRLNKEGRAYLVKHDLLKIVNNGQLYLVHFFCKSILKKGIF